MSSWPPDHEPGTGFLRRRPPLDDSFRCTRRPLSQSWGALPPGCMCSSSAAAPRAVRSPRTSLAAGRRLPFRRASRADAAPPLSGHDIFWWLDRIGRLDQNGRRPSSVASAAPIPLVTGAGGGHDIGLRRYAAGEDVRCWAYHCAASTAARHGAPAGPRRRAHRAGTTRPFRGGDGDGGRARAEDGPRRGSAGQPDPRAASGSGQRASALPRGYDLASAGIASVVDGPPAPSHRRLLAGSGCPSSRRARGESRSTAAGVTACPGLCFLGLPWLWKLKSSVLCGVGEEMKPSIAEDIEAAKWRPHRA